MKGKDLALLFALAGLWGASFLFIKVAVAEVTPTFLVAVRMVLATATLMLAAALMRRVFVNTESFTWDGLLRSWKPLMVLGLVNAVLPYLFIAWGEKWISSGAAAILNSTVPLFTALMVWVAHREMNSSERLGTGGVLGLLAGLLGVGVLVGGKGEGVGGVMEFMGEGAVLLGAASYGVGGLYARRHLKGVPVLVSAVGQNLAGAVWILPFAAVSGLPSRWPSAAALVSIAALGAVGTGIAYLLYFQLIARVGATRTTMVTYLLPAMALFYGALLLGEEVTPRAVIGLALILAGIAGVTGVVRWPRRAPPVP